MNAPNRGFFDGEMALGCAIGFAGIVLMVFIAGLGLGLMLR